MVLAEKESLEEVHKKLSPEQSRIRNMAFYSILQARPITPNRLHEITGMAIKQVETIIDELAHRGMIYLM